MHAFARYWIERCIDILGPARQPGGRPAYAFAKRCIDIVGSSMGLVLCAPIAPLLALAIKLDSPGPILFRQTRLGKGGRPFTLFKLRTTYLQPQGTAHMAYLEQVLRRASHPDRPAASQILPDDPRITRLGRFLRETNIDELPRLINVLRGDMSLVGPVPGLPFEGEHYSDRERERLVCKPGQTGLWQLDRGPGRRYEDMIRMDLEYVRRRCIWLDLALLFRTVAVVLGGRLGRTPARPLLVCVVDQNDVPYCGACLVGPDGHVVCTDSRGSATVPQVWSRALVRVRTADGRDVGPTRLVAGDEAPQKIVVPK